MEQQIFNRTQFASLLGVTPKGIDDLLKKGTIRALPAFDTPRFSIDELERLKSIDGRIKSVREIQLERLLADMTHQRDLLQAKINRIKEEIL